jgi:hypothetical protein
MIEQRNKFGHYIVNNKIFNNKLHAILHANETLADVDWYFNDAEFNSVDWTLEPNITLEDCYKLRAQQIRDSYDYVIIMYSGGADSTNVLTSFLNNNIKVDEIIAGAPLSGLKNYDFNKRTDATNQIGETYYAQLPQLEKYHQLFPNVKITIHDYFEDILALKDDSWIYENLGHWIHHSAGARHSLDKFTHIKALAEAGKRIAVVYGIDKPVLGVGRDDNMYVSFMDSIANIVTPHFKDRYTNVESVFFYYTPDMPELMVKQAHVLTKWLYMAGNDNLREKILHDRRKSLAYDPEKGKHWQRAIVPCIYPGIDHARGLIWQADKQTRDIAGGFQIDDWIPKLHKDLRVNQMVKSDLSLFLKNINDKYFLPDRTGLSIFMKSISIGSIENFINR